MINSTLKNSNDQFIIGAVLPKYPPILNATLLYLEEENEAHPLIVSVVFFRGFIVKVVAHSGMRHLYSDLEINEEILLFI